MLKNIIFSLFVFITTSGNMVFGCDNKNSTIEVVSSVQYKEINFDNDTSPEKIFLLDNYKNIEMLKETPIERNLININSKEKNDRNGNFLYVKPTDTSSKPILFFDNSNPSILDSLTMDSLEVIKFKKSQNFLSDYELISFGDLLVVPTEAGIDTYLFKNSIDFIYYTPEEIP